jgi:hypothetical protein
VVSCQLDDKAICYESRVRTYSWAFASPDSKSGCLPICISRNVNVDETRTHIFASHRRYARTTHFPKSFPITFNDASFSTTNNSSVVGNHNVLVALQHLSGEWDSNPRTDTSKVPLYIHLHNLPLYLFTAYYAVIATSICRIVWGIGFEPTGNNLLKLPSVSKTDHLIHSCNPSCCRRSGTRTHIFMLPKHVD